ncbi:hypothetical protein ElyMa_005143400 [Elysia marginata]|uniref:Uncharacterized protein n=1 Tax=Elysia marginata TaxID=1093978 RepID=A0AAV4JQ98_9GAST|nr:hypothetical protein ElyMa_005143400 [Elysia marginata]
MEGSPSHACDEWSTREGLPDTDITMYPTEHHLPLLKPEQGFSDTEIDYRVHDNDEVLPRKVSKLEAFFSTFHNKCKFRPLVKSSDKVCRSETSTASRYKLQDIEAPSSSSYNAKYPWRHKGRRRIQRLSYVLLAYVAGVLVLTAVRVGNSQPWYQQGAAHGLDLGVATGDAGGLTAHAAAARHRRDVRVEYVALAHSINHSDHHEGKTSMLTSHCLK